MANRQVGQEVRKLWNLFNRNMCKLAEKSFEDSVTCANGWIIGYLANNQDKEIYQKSLENEFKITRSTASKVVTLMEQKGYIIRESVDGDARLKRLKLTDKAWEVHNYIKHNVETTEEMLTKGFSAEEIEQLLGYLKRMEDNMKGGTYDSEL